MGVMPNLANAFFLSPVVGRNLAAVSPRFSVQVGAHASLTPARRLRPGIWSRSLRRPAEAEAAMVDIIMSEYGQPWVLLKVWVNAPTSGIARPS